MLNIAFSALSDSLLFPLETVKSLELFVFLLHTTPLFSVPPLDKYVTNSEQQGRANHYLLK